MSLAISRRSFVAAGAGGTAFGSVFAAAQTASPFRLPAKTEKKVALRFATSHVGVQPLAKPLRDVLKAMQDENPNLSISVEETPGNDHQTKIKLDASSDRMPDLFNYWRLDPGFGLDQIARAGRLADLTSWRNGDPFFQGLFDDSSWRTASLDGKVYGIPATMFYVQMLANREVFGRASVEIPKDWDGLNAAVKALKAKGELPWAISIGLDSQGGRIYNSIVNRLIGNERALRMHAGQEPINVPEMLKAAEFLRELIVGYAPEDAIAIKNEAVYAKYVNTNRGGLIIDGSWVNASIKPEIMKNMLPIEFPLIPGGVQKEPSVERDLTGLWYMSAKAYADEDRRPYCLEIMRRLSSRDAGKLYAEQYQLPIPMLGVSVDPEKVGPVAVGAQAIAMKNPANRWIPSVMRPDRRAKFEPLLSEFMNGKHQPAAFVEQLGRIFG